VSDGPELSNIREHLGWLVGRKVVDVTTGDPPDLPDADDEDADWIVLHFDNGGTLSVQASEFCYDDPDQPDEE
jgi:hypothetical protein